MADIEFCSEPGCGLRRRLCYSCAEKYEQALEEEARGVSIERFRKSAGRDITARWHFSFAAYLGKWAATPQPGTENPARRWIKALCHSDAGSAKAREDAKADALSRISFVVLHEILRRLPVEDPRNTPEDMEESCTVEERKVVAGIAEELADSQLRWRLGVDRLPDGERERVGMMFVALASRFLEGVAGFKVLNVEAVQSGATTKPRCLVPTKLGLQLLWGEHFGSANLLSRPKRYPMLVLPADWQVDGTGGGYRSISMKLVRNGSAKANVSKTVVVAVNHLQRAPWRVNRDVLEFVQQQWGDGGGRFGIPRRPTNDEGWQSVRQRSKKRDFLATVQTAERMGPAVFWLPQQIDWRGRIYPATEHLSVEDGKLARALLEFADGKPLGERGVDALALHGAICADADARTKAQQIAWVHEHSGQILLAADDPQSSELMNEAGEPLQFYAFALEWQRYVKAGKGPDFVSYLPVAQDHTCNGRQHIAALLRDEESGRLVNLIPSTKLDEPGDLYAEVQRLVSEKIASHDVKPDMGVVLDVKTTAGVDVEIILRPPLFRDASGKYLNRDFYGRNFWVRDGKWVPGAEGDDVWEPTQPKSIVRRKTVKKPVMTYDYSAGQKTFRDAALQWIVDNPPDSDGLWRGDGADWDWRLQLHYAAPYLASMLWDVMEDDSYPATRAGQRWRMWAQSVANAFSNANTPVSWTVPHTGLQVQQNGWGYWRHTLSQKTVKLDGEEIGRLTIWTKTNRVKAAKQRSGIGPNIIHSLDAAALMLTINRAAALSEPVTALGTVHDCYYTLAADAAGIGRCAREAFVQLHGDALDNLHKQFQAQVGGVPNLPKRGTLDITGVLNSEYFLS